MSGARRLLTIGHSYVVAQNRRLADEMSRQGQGRWQVTAVAPARLQGDLRPIAFEPIAGEQCTAVTLPMWWGSHPHLRAYGRGLRALLRQPWDLVHCWEEPYVLAAAQVAMSIRPQTQFVPATFQNIAKRYPFPVAAVERRVMRRANGWIAFGRSVHEALASRPEYAARPSRMISPGVDTATFTPDAGARRVVRERLGWSDAHFVVGFTGRFVPEKGIGTLLSAMDGSAHHIRWLFVGGGPLQAEVERARTRHPGRVAVINGVVHDEVAAYLNAMDVLCAPSRSTPRWREQFGRMLIEAMACGVPVIASASGEIPHVLGDAGRLLPEQDEAAWAAEIERMAGDPGLRAELRALGIERAHGRFAWPVVARAHLKFFEELCEP